MNLELTDEQKALRDTVATVGPLTGPRPTAVETTEGLALRGDIAAQQDAAAADVVLVLAEDRGGTGLFAVDATSAGVSVTDRAHVDQTRKLFDVRFDDVAAQRLASPPPEEIGGLVDDVLIASAADALGAQDGGVSLGREDRK